MLVAVVASFVVVVVVVVRVRCQMARSVSAVSGPMTMVWFGAWPRRLCVAGELLEVLTGPPPG